MPFLGPGQGGRLPQMEPWDAGGRRTPEPDAAWWAPHTILPLPSCTESYKRMAPAFLSSVGIRWAGRSSKGLSPPEGWALPLQIAQTTGGAQLPCPHTARAAREVLGRAEDMHLGLKAAPNTVLDIYTQRAQAGRREGGSSSVPTAFCSKCLTEAISQHRDLEAMPVFTSLFRLTRTEWEKKKKGFSTSQASSMSLLKPSLPSSDRPSKDRRPCCYRGKTMEKQKALGKHTAHLLGCFTVYAPKAFVISFSTSVVNLLAD